jgi:hypothetical protein
MTGRGTNSAKPFPHRRGAPESAQRSQPPDFVNAPFAVLTLTVSPRRKVWAARGAGGHTASATPTKKIADFIDCAPLSQAEGHNRGTNWSGFRTKSGARRASTPREDGSVSRRRKRQCR